MATKAVILAIDDDTIILNTVVSTLKEEYSVRPFTTGESALQYLQTHMVDLILLDYKMPGMSGFEVLKCLQENSRTRHIPTVFLTGSISGDSEVTALEMGAADYIQKPVQPQILLTRVRLQLELQNHRKHLVGMVEQKTQSLNAAYSKLKMREEITLSLLARVTDMRDHDTGDHINRTTEFVRIMTQDLIDSPALGYSLTRYEADDIVRSTKLHDLGKIAMPDRVLLKPGRLSTEEFAVIKLHPVHGEQLLSNFVLQMDDSFLNAARDIAYSHHERWDGTGYPQGLRESEIPISGRIVAIADVYDALTSKRPYKDAYSHQQSVDIIREGSGTQFDPFLVNIFIARADAFYQVRASSDQEAPLLSGP